MSTAIFAASFYVIISAFFSPNTELAVLSVSVTEGFFDLFKILIQTLIIPIKHFDVSYFLANGELIEFNYIFKLFFKYMIPRALPLFLLGIYFYNKRELGLVERK